MTQEPEGPFLTSPQSMYCSSDTNTTYYDQVLMKYQKCLFFGSLLSRLHILSSGYQSIFQRRDYIQLPLWCFPSLIYTSTDHLLGSLIFTDSLSYLVFVDLYYFNSR